MGFLFQTDGYNELFFGYTTGALEWANGLNYKDPSKILELRGMLKSILEAPTELESMNRAWNTADFLIRNTRRSNAQREHWGDLTRFGYGIRKYAVDAFYEPSLREEHLKVLTGPAREFYLKSLQSLQG